MTWAIPKTSSAQRGYGTAHSKARAAAALRHQPSDPCARCGHALGPMGPWLHWDHNDQRTGYLGFSHGRRRCPYCGRKCNIRAGAIKGARVRNRRARIRKIITADRW
jgi:hypothetical protein